MSFYLHISFFVRLSYSTREASLTVRVLKTSYGVGVEMGVAYCGGCAMLYIDLGRDCLGCPGGHCILL